MNCSSQESRYPHHVAALINSPLSLLPSLLVQVYSGYVDDIRNTDHAWMETVAMNFHDETGWWLYVQSYDKSNIPVS